MANQRATIILRGGALLCGWLLSAPAGANDTSISSTPGRVRILKNRAIQMESERIELRFEGPCLGARAVAKEGEWTVHARYRFRNQRSTKQRVRMGFPEWVCNPSEFGHCAGDDPSFREMVTRVRGKAVKQEVVKLDPKAKESLDRIWAFDLEFGPKETLEVEHRFKVVGAIDNAGARSIHYLVGTGKNWRGPIASAQFRILLPAYVTALRALPDGLLNDEQPTGLKKEYIKYVEEGGKTMLELSYAAKNWAPATDYVGVDFESSCFGSYNLQTPKWTAKDRAAKLGQAKRYCEWKDVRLAVMGGEEASKKLAEGSSDLEICAQAIYALRGRPFKDSYLRNYFYAETKAPQKVPVGVFEENPHYTKDFLTHADHKALARIQAAQKLRTLPPPKEAAVRKQAPLPARAESGAKRMRAWCSFQRDAQGSWTLAGALLLLGSLRRRRTARQSAAARA